MLCRGAEWYSRRLWLGLGGAYRPGRLGGGLSTYVPNPECCTRPCLCKCLYQCERPGSESRERPSRTRDTLHW